MPQDDRGLEAIFASPQLPRLSSVNTCGTRLTREGVGRVKAVVAERWERGQETTVGGVYCWVYTDYDERIITYEAPA